jgi:hypothetical protein
MEFAVERLFGPVKWLVISKAHFISTGYVLRFITNKIKRDFVLRDKKTKALDQPMLV